MSTVYINGRESKVETPEITYEQLIHIVYGFEGYPRPTVQYTRGTSEKSSGVMLPGQSVPLKDGMVFDVVFTGFA